MNSILKNAADPNNTYATYRTLFNGVWGTVRMGTPLQVRASVGSLEKVAVVFKLAVDKAYVSDNANGNLEVQLDVLPAPPDPPATNGTWPWTAEVSQKTEAPMAMIVGATLDDNQTYTVAVKARYSTAEGDPPASPIDGPFGFLAGLRLSAQSLGLIGVQGGQSGWINVNGS